MSQDSNADIVQTWPHAEGIVRLAFSPDGNILYTSGQEGYIRAFDSNPKADPPTDPTLIEYHQEAITCISTSNEYICSASESGNVTIHNHRTNEHSGLLLRSSMPVRSARFDPRGRRVAVASDELIVKVVNVKDPLQVTLLTGHKKPVRETTWSPDGSLLATSSSDGEIRIWELSGTEATCVKILEGLIPADEPESEYSVEVVWHPSGKYFVVASKTNEIIIVSRETWNRTGVFSHADGHTGQISALTWSANGNYLASAAADKQVIIWSNASRSIINRTQIGSEGLVTGMAFHPSAGVNMLSYVSFSGQFFRWTGPIPLNLQGPSEGVKNTNAQQLRSASPSNDSNNKNRGRGESVQARENGGGSKRKEIEQQEDGTSDFGEDDWIDDDMGNAVNERIYGGEKERALPARLWDSGDNYSSSSSKGQEAFQPGSTPFKSNRRYLSFNLLGYVHVVEREDQNLITIVFHDSAIRTGSHFSDTFRYSLAALGESGAVFASKSTGDETLSYIHYRPHESWTTIQEWTYPLPSKENVVLVAVGGMSEPIDQDDDDEEGGHSSSGTVVVATDKGYIRFFSGSGLQKYVWHFGEEIVSISAGKDWVFLVHRSSETKSTLEYTLIDTDTYEIVQNGRMPLAKGVTLKWIGMTDEQIPAMYDSNGLFSVLDRSRRPKQARWVPVLDTNTLARREGKQESYWPVGLTEAQAHVIILKGEEQYPHFPTPLFQELTLQVPTLRLEVAQGQLEEQYLRSNLFLSHLRDGLNPNDILLQSQLTTSSLTLDKSLLKIIQTSCKSDKLQAALDCTLLLSQVASMDAAVKIAGFFNLQELKRRMERVREGRIKSDEGEEEGGLGKRESKWEHRVDDRTILAPNPMRSRTNGTGFYEDHKSIQTPARSTAGRSTFSRTPASSAIRNSNGGGAGRLSSDGALPSEDMMGMEVDEDEEERGEENDDVDDDAGEESDDGKFVVPPPKTVNPFAKKAPLPVIASVVASPGPFSKVAQHEAKGIEKTNSFYARVESHKSKESNSKKVRLSESNGAETEKSTKVAKAKTTPNLIQPTLFGMGPGKAVESKRGRKRKSEVANDDDKSGADEEDSTSKGKGKEKSTATTLDGLFKSKAATAAVTVVGSIPSSSAAMNELPREGEEFEESQMETQDETQEHQKKSTEVEMETEEIQDEEEETQMEETQVDEEKTAPITAANDGISKLASFGYKAKVATIIPSVEE